MKKRAGFASAVAVAVTGVLMTGCQNGVTGPSLSANYHDVTLRPTVAGLVGGENVCCCHLAGRITNTSSVAVDAEVTFNAVGADDRTMGTASDMVTNVPPGETRPFLAVGITSACREVSLSQVVADGRIRLKGLWKPE
jgi:hypothetical protein